MVNSLKQTRISKNIAAGTIAGGIIGSVLGYLYKIMGILSTDPTARVLTGAAIGVILGGAIGVLAAKHRANSAQVLHDTDHKSTLQLKEEQLDILKKQIQTGAVTVHKELIDEEKNVLVPTTRAELVIEKKSFDTQNANKTDEHCETIRIPISEERVEITKHPVALNDVSIYKRQLHDTVRVEEPCKKEKLVVKTSGNPKINK